MKKVVNRRTINKRTCLDNLFMKRAHPVLHTYVKRFLRTCRSTASGSQYSTWYQSIDCAPFTYYQAYFKSAFSGWPAHPGENVQGVQPHNFGRARTHPRRRKQENVSVRGIYGEEFKYSSSTAGELPRDILQPTAVLTVPG